MGELKAKTIEMMCSKEITMGIDNVCTIIPTMRGLIAPVFNVAYDMQREKGDVNIKKIHGYSDGLWISSVCINTYTNIFHN